MLLAETVSLDGGLIAFLLVVLFLMLVAWAAVVVFGCIAARRAARGSSTAAMGWGLAGVVECLPGIWQGRPNTLLLGGLAALGVQTALYLREREAGPGAPGPGAGETDSGAAE